MSGRASSSARIRIKASAVHLTPRRDSSFFRSNSVASGENIPASRFARHISSTKSRISSTYHYSLSAVVIATMLLQTLIKAVITTYHGASLTTARTNSTQPIRKRLVLNNNFQPAVITLLIRHYDFFIYPCKA